MDSMLGHAVAMNQYLLDAHLKAFKKAEYDRKVRGANCARWIAGHIAASRRGIAARVGCTLAPKPWLKHFPIGASGKICAGWPSMAEITRDLKQSSAALHKALNKGAPKTLARKTAFIIPGMPKVTVAHNVMFMINHESYHVGQIGMLGRMFGHQRFA
jgi:uncharacterized damage-inducible protein DinB